ncbi:hypothetical protein ACFQVC_27985 [Streptomyces monticola]|uniref:Transposase n=1 Tax=Streptomyces monticola TaxID=2666263 RepID=A0ABW2JQP5_9ACTN
MCVAGRLLPSAHAEAGGLEGARGDSQGAGRRGARPQAINQLKSVLVFADTERRESLAGPSNLKLFNQCTTLAETEVLRADGVARHPTAACPPHPALTEEINNLTRQRAEAIKASTPGLLDVQDPARTARRPCSSRPVTTLNTSAARRPLPLCVASARWRVEASSGKPQSRRLNHCGDRQSNAAVHRIVLGRLRWQERFQDYLRRRLAEGEMRREIIRCLKRYAAREIYRLIVPINIAADYAAPTQGAH